MSGNIRLAEAIRRIKMFALAAGPGDEAKYLTQIVRVCDNFEIATEACRIATADQSPPAPLGSEVRENRELSPVEKMVGSK